MCISCVKSWIERGTKNEKLRTYGNKIDRKGVGGGGGYKNRILWKYIHFEFLGLRLQLIVFKTGKLTDVWRNNIFLWNNTISWFIWFLFILFIRFIQCYWKKNIVSIERDRPFPLKFWTKNRLFLRPQLSLESKTITNQQRIGC